MRIRHVTITVPDPSETAHFLANVFGFPARQEPNGVTLSVGSSHLTLTEGPTEPDGFYHLAFDIPENTVPEARNLLASKVPILDGGDNGINTASPSWNAHSVYFNAPGNLNLELIGRHRLPNAISEPFSLANILHISEVGVPVDNPLVAVQMIEERTGLPRFDEPSEMFAPVGSDDGLLIVVKRGRIWFPTEDQSTTQRPLRIEIDGIAGKVVLDPACTILGRITEGTSS